MTIPFQYKYDPCNEWDIGSSCGLPETPISLGTLCFYPVLNLGSPVEGRASSASQA